MIESSAIFSPCRTYRYQLWRRWGPGQPVVFIGLNPSTADESQDDPTIRRCIGYAQAWGYPALLMLNLFAFRATNPKDMMIAKDPVGPENDRHLLKECLGRMTIAAWGKDGSHLGRSASIAIHGLHCLKLNHDGSPAHPLYLKKTLTPAPYVR